MRLPKLEWNDPLADAYKIMDNKIEAHRSGAFEAAYNRYAQKLHHVSLIWERLYADSEAYEKHLELATSNIRNLPLSEIRTLPPDEVRALRELENGFKTLYLDCEDFLIHAKMLMDRVVFFLQFFFRRTDNMPSFHRFTPHRNDLIANKAPFQDEEYARYIREDTHWYETILRSYRDDLVVHDIRFRSMGVSSGPNESFRLFRARMSKGETIEQDIWASLMKLREKYLHRIPGLDIITVNVYELIDFLDSHSALIEPSDLETLKRLRKSIGGKLPDLIELANHIQQFLTFLGEHFERIANSQPKTTMD